MTNRRIKKMFYGNIYMLWVIICLVVSSTSLCANDQIDSLMNLITKHKNSPEQIKSLIDSYYFIVTDQSLSATPEKSIQYADTMLNFARQINDKLSILKAQVAKARIYVDVSHADSAIVQLEQLLPAIQKTNNLQLLADAYSTLGSGYNKIDKLDKSLEYYFHLLETSENKKELFKKTALGYLSISALLYKQEHISGSMEYAIKARNAFSTLKEYNYLAHALTAIGSCYLTLESYDSAKVYLEQAVVVAKQHGTPNSKNMTLNNLALVYYRTKDFKRAIPIFLEVVQTSKAPLTVGAAYNNLISCYIKTKNLFKAKQTAEEAIEYLGDSSLFALRSTTYSLMSDIYSLENNFEKALQYYKISKDLEDSLNDQRNLSHFNELNIQYETAQKEHKIAKLKSEQDYQANVRSILVIAIFALSVALILALYFYLKNRKLIKTLSISNEHIQMVNKRLESTNIALEQSHVEKNEFLGIVAHDLKNPIANISLIADTMKKFIDDDSPLIEMIGDINTFTTNMIDLITNLLDINAIESGKFNINTTEIYPYETLLASVYMNKNAASKKNINLVLNAPEQSLIINYDEKILREIVENYVSNAIKFSPLDKSIYISLNKLENGAIKIAVKDEGPGLSEGDKAKLFSKYTKLTARPTGGENSTGLGLSIAKKLAELLNSQVLCESTLGQGAEFSLIIPAECNTTQ